MHITVKEYRAKRIINKHKHPDTWFWTRYSAHPYIGCEHNCIYCYTREEKYTKFEDPADFSRIIKVKVNAQTLLRKELYHLSRDVIGIGDWQPVEERYKLSRQMLQVCSDLGFPVFVLEKSDLILRDIDVLQQIVAKGLNVITGFSIITTRDDKTRRLFEPGAPSVKRRFVAMKKFAKAGLLTGTALMPVLPFIYDDDENLEAVVSRTKECGGQYVLVGSLTMASPQREWYYNALKDYDPSLIDRYDSLYDGSTSYAPNPKYLGELGRRVEDLCKKYGLRDRIPRPIPKGPLSFNFRVGEILYDRAYRLTLAGISGYREFAFRKAGWIVEDLPQSILDVWEKGGRSGLQAIHGVGPKLAAEIESAIKEVLTQETSQA